MGLTAGPKFLALAYARFLWQFPYLERIQGVLDGVQRGPVGPPGPLVLAALGARVIEARLRHVAPRRPDDQRAWQDQLLLVVDVVVRPARAGNRRKGRLSALRAHTKAPYKTDLLWETLRNAKAA